MKCPFVLKRTNGHTEDIVNVSISMSMSYSSGIVYLQIRESDVVVEDTHEVV